MIPITRLNQLLTKPGHIVALELFLKKDKWRATLEELCNQKDEDGLDRCLEVLKKVLLTPFLEIKQDILKVSGVAAFFTWYIKQGLAKENWELRKTAEVLIKSISKVSIPGYIQELFDEKLLAAESLPRESVRSILPTLNDFDENSSPPPIESLPVSGPIDDLSRYFALQLNLLREDLLHDLRGLVQEIRTSTVSKKCFTGITLTRNDLFEVFISNPPAVPASDLKTGTLLLLSTTYQFSDLILATVHSFDVKDRDVKIELIAEEKITVDIFNRPLVMLISPVFFEPLHRVHQQLLTMRKSSHLPFKDILLRLDQSAQTRKVQNILPVITGLLPKQVDAVVAAVSQRMTLIEGPPGTGKSLIGQRTIENFLTNLKKADKKILVICVTNHALDEVLMGLSKTTNSIVRFGTQSKERELDEFNIKNLESGPPNSLVTETLALVRESFQKDLTNNSNGKLSTSIQLRAKYLRVVQEIKSVAMLDSIRSKSVIGMTTAAAARLHILLELYEPHVLVAEEAAEILECHSIAALTRSLKQVVLIGDHHQLRATVQVPQLASKYNFDVSLFERLVTNGLNVVQLNQQSRMRPELAALVRGIFYDDYENNESVSSLPDHVRGVATNLFFLDHNYEERKTMNKSKMNSFEAVFSLQLAEYLLKQGYSASSLVILSFYNGHVDMINAKRSAPRYRHLLKDIRVRTVDNFQGEEADIVILNAVRSNEEMTLGHVAVNNRVCTALTRAKFGLFVIGNATVLCGRSKVWKKMVDRLKDKEAVGKSFPLQCEKHRTLCQIESVKDFDDHVNDAGGCCKEVCDLICVQCGAKCGLECHASMVCNYDGCDC